MGANSNLNIIAMVTIHAQTVADNVVVCSY